MVMKKYFKILVFVNIVVIVAAAIFCCCLQRETTFAQAVSNIEKAKSDLCPLHNSQSQAQEKAAKKSDDCQCPKVTAAYEKGSLAIQFVPLRNNLASLMTPSFIYPSSFAQELISLNSPSGQLASSVPLYLQHSNIRI